MKYRIVEFSDGTFSLQHRRFFMWFDNTRYLVEFDVNLPIYYDSKEEAVDAYERKRKEKLKEKNKMKNKWELPKI